MTPAWLAFVPLALLLARIAPIAFLLPYFGARSMPSASRVGLLVVLAVGTVPSVVAGDPIPVLATSSTWVLALVQNLATGITLALVLGLPFFALEFAARSLDAARGALVFDDSPDDEASPLASLVRWTFLVTFLAAGGLRATLRIIEASTRAVALHEPLHTGGRSIELVARFSSDALAAGISALAAVWVAWASVEIVFAVAARSSPAWGQPAVPLPARTLVPLAVVALSVGAWTGAAMDLARTAIAAARSFTG
jgi:type III secretory pathway component EscT